MRNVILSALALPWLAGCTPPPAPPVWSVDAAPAEVAAYQHAVANETREPDAAEFRYLHVVRDSGGRLGLCGELNGKNAHGGYTGFLPFFAAIIPGRDHAVATVWEGRQVGWDTIARKCTVTS